MKGTWSKLEYVLKLIIEKSVLIDIFVDDFVSLIWNGNKLP